MKFALLTVMLILSTLTARAESIGETDEDTRTTPEFEYQEHEQRAGLAFTPQEFHALGYCRIDRKAFLNGPGKTDVVIVTSGNRMVFQHFENNAKPWAGWRFASFKAVYSRCE